jgi:hypothetical protein
MVPTQPPIQWVPGFCPGGKVAGALRSPLIYISAEVQNDWNYTSAPTRFPHGVEWDIFTFLCRHIIKGESGTMIQTT